VSPVSSTFKYSGCFCTLKDKTSSISEISDTFLSLPLAIVRTGWFKIINKFIEYYLTSKLDTETGKVEHSTPV